MRNYVTRHSQIVELRNCNGLKSLARLVAVVVRCFAVYKSLAMTDYTHFSVLAGIF